MNEERTPCSREAASTYLLVLDHAHAGSPRCETFAYSNREAILHVLERELSVSSAVDRVLLGQTMDVLVVERGRLVMGVDVREHVRIVLDDDTRWSLDERIVLWNSEHEANWVLRQGSDGRAPEREDFEQPLSGLRLRCEALLAALPPLRGRPLQVGEHFEKIEASGEEPSLALARRHRRILSRVRHGYRDHEGTRVALAWFSDPEPPAEEDIEAWLEQELHPREATRLAHVVVARGDIEAARRLMRVAREQGLRVAPLEAVLRPLSPPGSGAPPLRPSAMSGSVDIEAILGDADPSSSSLRDLLSDRGLEPAARSGLLEQLARAPGLDPSTRVVAHVLRAFAKVGRYDEGLDAAIEVPSDALLPCLLAATRHAREDSQRSERAITELVGRLDEQADSSAIDRRLVRLVPAVLQIRSFQDTASALQRAKREPLAALVFEAVARLEPDPDHSCELAARAGTLHLLAGNAGAALRSVRPAIRYWQAHASLRHPRDIVHARLVEAAAMAQQDYAAGVALRDALIIEESELCFHAGTSLARFFQPPAPPRGVPGQRVGDAVVHTKFGPGEVVAVDGQGEGVKLTVRFEQGATKTLLARFLRPAHSAS